MRKLVLSLAALSLMQISGIAQAVEYKLGFVNTERLIREAAPAQKAQKKLDKEFEPRNLELQKMAKQAKDLQTYLEREGVTIGESERRNKERDLANLNRDFQRAQREIREDANLRRNEELAGVHERIGKAINAIAESEKFDIIVQEALYASHRIDITDKVLKALADK